VVAIIPDFHYQMYFSMGVKDSSALPNNDMGFLKDSQNEIGRFLAIPRNDMVCLGAQEGRGQAQPALSLPTLKKNSVIPNHFLKW
jgi:hypothetical protein